MAVGHSVPPSALTASLSFENEKKTGRVTAPVTQSQREGNLQGQCRREVRTDGRDDATGGECQEIEEERREPPRRATWRRRRREISSRLKGGRGVRRREEKEGGREGGRDVTRPLGRGCTFSAVDLGY